MKESERELLFRKADAYDRQAAFYAARAQEAYHTAVASDYFRREAARLRRIAGSIDNAPLLAAVR
jgi:hypothetical protein